MSAENNVRNVCAAILPPDIAGKVAAQAGESRFPHRFQTLAEQIRAVQRTAVPISKEKALVIFAADRFGEREDFRAGSISRQVRPLISAPNAVGKLAEQHHVRLALVDVGLMEEFPIGKAASPIFRHRVSDEAAAPAHKGWESLDAGVTAGCRLKAQGVDLFGLSLLGRSSAPDLSLPMENALMGGDLESCLRQIGNAGAWDLGAAAGFILAAAYLSTPVVISGAAAGAAAELARILAPAVQHCLIWAQPLRGSGTSTVEPLLDLGLPDALAVIVAMGMCESAVRCGRDHGS